MNRSLPGGGGGNTGGASGCCAEACGSCGAAGGIGSGSGGGGCCCWGAAAEPLATRLPGVAWPGPCCRVAAGGGAFATGKAPPSTKKSRTSDSTASASPMSDM